MIKINFKQPKYIFPLVIFVPLCALIYFVMQTFGGSGTTENVVATDRINMELPEANAEEAGDKMYEMTRRFGDEDAFTAVGGIGEEDKDEEKLEHGYSEEELNSLDAAEAERIRQQQELEELYEQIYQYIKDEIRKGNIRPEKQLPSSRELAKSLKVSRSTTQLAYEQLVSEGYLEAVPRKGYFVASLDGIFPPVAQSVAARPDQKKELSLGMEKESVRGQLFREKFEVDFSPRGIDLEGFPYATWRKISRSVLKEEDRELFLKGEPQGDLILREAIREYLHAARGVNCDVSQIIIGAGNEYLLMLLSQIIGRDAVIAMENPTYRQAYRVLSGVGHKVLPVGIDKNGFCVKELEDQTAQAAYVMPSHQFPTGIVMPVKRRQELLSWAGELPGRYLIEDDYDSGIISSPQ